MIPGPPYLSKIEVAKWYSPSSWKTIDHETYSREWALSLRAYLPSGAIVAKRCNEVKNIFLGVIDTIHAPGGASRHRIDQHSSRSQVCCVLAKMIPIPVAYLPLCPVDRLTRASIDFLEQRALEGPTNYALTHNDSNADIDMSNSGTQHDHSNLQVESGIVPFSQHPHVIADDEGEVMAKCSSRKRKHMKEPEAEELEYRSRSCKEQQIPKKSKLTRDKVLEKIVEEREKDIQSLTKLLGYNGVGKAKLTEIKTRVSMGESLKQAYESVSRDEEA